MNTVRVREKRAIEMFVRHLADLKCTPMCVTHWPDTKGEREIDAIAEGGGWRFAIEHTSTDWFDRQRRDDDAFDRILASLACEMNATPGPGIRGNFELTVDFGASSSAARYDHSRETLKQWFLDEAHSLPCGRHRHCVPGIPFEVTVDRRPSDGFRLRVSRVRDEGCGESLSDRLASLVGRKAQKLALYVDNEPRHVTVLLIEIASIVSGDPDPSTVIRNIMTKRGVSPIDEIWWAESVSVKGEESCIHFAQLWPS